MLALEYPKARQRLGRLASHDQRFDKHEPGGDVLWRQIGGATGRCKHGGKIAFHLTKPGLQQKRSWVRRGGRDQLRDAVRRQGQLPLAQRFVSRPDGG